MIYKHVRTLFQFVSQRHHLVLPPQNIWFFPPPQQVDLLVLLGNGIPHTVDVAANLYKTGQFKQMMVVGGIGHATKHLKDTLLLTPEYRCKYDEATTEAAIFSQILKNNFNISGPRVILEKESENCGQNAQNALALCNRLGIAPQKLMLVQDPTMLLRSHLTFERYWAGSGCEIMSYSPLENPIREHAELGFELISSQVKGIWTSDRFLDLILGEIPRLRNDENGYGPKGRHYINAITIPDEVLDAYSALVHLYPQYQEIKLRK